MMMMEPPGSSEDESMRSGASATSSNKRARSDSLETTDEGATSAVTSSSEEEDADDDTDADEDTDDDDDDAERAAWDVDTPRHDGSRAPASRRRRVERYGPLRRVGPLRQEDVVATVRLMSEVEALRRQRDELLSIHYGRVLQAGSRDALVNTTLDYYDTFRDGFYGPRLPGIFRFFNTRLDQELFAYGGGGLGLDTWIEQWRRYTVMFPSTSMRLRSMNVIELTDPTDQGVVAVPDDPTVATYMIDTHGVLDGIITRRAVCTLFPHLQHREDLIQKLVGRSLNLPLNLRFYFNYTGRVIRYDFDGDYFQALSNLEDVGLIELTQIMEHMTIGENTTVPDIVELPDDDQDPIYDVSHRS